MGRHAAEDGDAVHPVIAAALARRTTEPVAVHHSDVTQRIEGDLGWPGEPPAGGGGLGWPGDLTPVAPSTSSASAAGDADRSDETDEEAPEEPAPELAHEHRRRGWRRLLGLERAA